MTLSDQPRKCLRPCGAKWRFRGVVTDKTHLYSLSTAPLPACVADGGSLAIAAIYARALLRSVDLLAHVRFTPTSASWLNMVECFFRDLTQKRLRRGVFQDLEQLIS